MPTQTWYEYISSLCPSKLARFMRTKLAHNQGCPPANLLHIFTMCKEHGSCDECWWSWLLSQRNEDPTVATVNKDVIRCWDCRWGARDYTDHPYVGCFNPRFYGAVMGIDDYCSEGVPRYEMDKDLDSLKRAAKAAAAFGEITEENEKEIGKELQRRYELKQLERELARRGLTPEKITEAKYEPDEDTGEETS